MITTEGIVLRERSFGEQDKFIDILTKDRGILEVSVKGSKKITGKSGSSTQLFAYSDFCIDERAGRFYLNSAEPIHIFYDLRNSLSKISLASYFSEVLRSSVTDEYRNSDILRLMLNSLYFIEKDLRSEKLIKSIFEMRYVSEIGFMPDVVGCKDCGKYEPSEVFFFIDDGFFLCGDCFKSNNESNYIRITLPVLNAVRHIVLSDFDRLFNFRMSETAGELLSVLTEKYIVTQLDRNFRTLDFYHQVNFQI